MFSGFLTALNLPNLTIPIRSNLSYARSFLKKNGQGLALSVGHTDGVPVLRESRSVMYA